MMDRPMPDTWTAVDGLGRSLPMGGDVPEPRADRFVGLFYWTWHNEPRNPPMNNTRLFRDHPEALHDVDHPLWQGEFRSHHWDEPLFGYYLTTDRWVLRKHAELLADAQVDVVVFDNTNGTLTWRDSHRSLMEVFAQARRDGVQAPGVAFMLPLFPDQPENTRAQLHELYRGVYRANFHSELWFRWKGKPLIMAYPEALHPDDPLDAEILDFFTFRPGQASYIRGQERPDHWGWLSVHPQQVYRNADGLVEQTTVGVAQNHSSEMGLTAMNGTHIFGRTYTSKGYDGRPDAKLRGANFQEQFEHALSVDPEFIFITGWNEWIAGRHAEWQGVTNAFPDQFDEVYSRDIEPCAGDLRDHYYYQMVANIRRFKGARQVPDTRVPDTASYPHYRGNVGPRDADGYETVHHSEPEGPNDIIGCSVSHDEQAIRFRVTCAGPISSPDGKGWMRLFLRVHPEAPSWEGFDFIVNRTQPGMLEQSLGEWNWMPICTCEQQLVGNDYEVSIPRQGLRLPEGSFHLSFKWADHMMDDGSPLAFYLHGDCAPGGRFAFCYHGVMVENEQSGQSGCAG